MAKKRKNNSSLLKYGVMLFGLVLVVVGIILFLTLKVSTVKVGDEVLSDVDSLSFTGAQLMFGYTIEGAILEYQVLNFSFVVLLVLIVAVLGVILMFTKMKLLNLVGLVLVVVSAVLIIVAPQAASITEELEKFIETINGVWGSIEDFLTGESGSDAIGLVSNTMGYVSAALVAVGGILAGGAKVIMK